MRNRLHTFDQRVVSAFNRLPKWMRTPMMAMTFLGQPLITFGAGALIIGLGIGKNLPGLTAAGFVAVATLVIGSLLKLALRRKRPATEYVEHMFLDTFSFPSGHAAGTVPIFGLVAYLVVLANEPWSLTVASSIAIVIFLIGVSRVYLGAHYASDVIGGWLIGLAGLAVIVFAAQPTL